MLKIICSFLSVFGFVSLLAAGPAPDLHKKHPGKEFFNARKHKTEYAGPGREDAAPGNLKEIRIGYFGPFDCDDQENRDTYLAACMAVEDANKRGGYRSNYREHYGINCKGGDKGNCKEDYKNDYEIVRKNNNKNKYREGIPFRLIPGWSKNPWGSGVKQLTRMVYLDRVWAIIGGIDGPSTHLAEQVVAKARLPLVSPTNTDKTVNLANVPWMFSCSTDDHIQAPVLAEAIEVRAKRSNFIIVASDDHDSYFFADELEKSLSKRSMFPAYQFTFKKDNSGTTIRDIAEKIIALKTGFVVIVAGSDDSAHLLKALRNNQFQGMIFGGPKMGYREFLKTAGKAAEGVIFPLLVERGEQFRAFEIAFRSRYKHAPEPVAAYGYDSTCLVLEAIRRAGPNRARINDAIRALSPWDGAAGEIKWDGLGSNTRLVNLAIIRSGKIVPFRISINKHIPSPPRYQ